MLPIHKRNVNSLDVPKPSLRTLIGFFNMILIVHLDWLSLTWCNTRVGSSVILLFEIDQLNIDGGLKEVSFPDNED